MYREFLMNKWVLSGVAFLILFSFSCYLWYEYETVPYKQEATETAEIARQWKTEKSRTSGLVETVSAQPDGDSRASTGQPITQTTTNDVVETENRKYPVKTDGKPQVEQNDVSVSPFGFGPYPKVPEDYPSKVSWNRHYPDATDEVRRELELISRVLVKLWTDGDKNFRGGSTYKGKVYPHYNDTVYVKYKYGMIDGRWTKYGVRAKSGPQVSYNMSDLDNPPPHLRILDLDSSGFDPYQFLDLP